MHLELVLLQEVATLGESDQGEAALEGLIAVAAALEAESREAGRLLIRRDRQALGVEHLLRRAQAARVPVQWVQAEATAGRGSGQSHGVTALAGSRCVAALEDLVAGKARPCVDMLDGVEDRFSGAAVRSLNAEGIDGVVLRPCNWTTAAGIVGRLGRRLGMHADGRGRDDP